MHYLGIDPDVDKSGVALWNSKEKKFDFIGRIAFWDLVQYIQDTHNELDVEVRVEAGWLNKKANYHFAPNRFVGEKIARSVGQNEMIGMLIFSYCQKAEIRCVAQRPSGTKWNDETFRNMTKLNRRTNGEERDACRLVFGL